MTTKYISPSPDTRRSIKDLFHYYLSQIGKLSDQARKFALREVEMVMGVDCSPMPASRRSLPETAGGRCEVLVIWPEL